jgi:hypothetical protein
MLTDWVYESAPTVAKARRQSTGNDLPVGKRTGRDGFAMLAETTLRI